MGDLLKKGKEEQIKPLGSFYCDYLLTAAQQRPMFQQTLGESVEIQLEIGCHTHDNLVSLLKGMGYDFTQLQMKATHGSAPEEFEKMEIKSSGNFLFLKKATKLKKRCVI